MRKTPRRYDAKTALKIFPEDRSKVTYAPDKPIFCQGDAADCICFLKQGKVKLTVVSKAGREAAVGLLIEGDFLGEGILAGETARAVTATPLSPATVVRIERAAAMRALKENAEFSKVFLDFLLARNRRIEEDLVDQLFNSCEKRLARLLLRLSGLGEGHPAPATAKISQETLAEIVGTTRSRVSYFMNKFRRQGFIQYNGRLQVHRPLLKTVLED